MTGRGRRLMVGILAMLGILCLGIHLASPAWASGGGGAKEGEGEEAVLEVTRRPSPVVDPMDVIVAEAAVKAKDAGEEREIERHEEPVVTPLTLALSSEEGAPKGEGAETREVEIKRRLELKAPKPPAEDETKGKGKKKGGEGEGEAEAPPAEIEATRHPEAVVSKLAALLDKVEPPKGEGESEPPEVEMERHEEPVIDPVSLAFTKAAANTKAGGEGEGGAGSGVEFERHPQAYFEKETPLEAKLKNKDKKEGEVEVEAEFTRHPELQVGATEIAIAMAEGANKGEGGVVESEFPRKRGLVIDPVDAALDKVGGKAKGEGEGAEVATEIARKPEPVASESEIPGLESVEEGGKEPHPKQTPETAHASPEPDHGQLFTPHGVIGEKPAAVLDTHAGQKAELAKKWPGRDLSTPARRLIGHWTFRLGSVQGDYWFAPLDPRSASGSLIVNDQGTLRRGSWRLVKEDLQAQAVTVSSRLLAADPFTFPIPEHGATLIEMYSPESALTLEYADQGTAPGVARGKQAGASPQGARPRRSAVARRAGSLRHE